MQIDIFGNEQPPEIHPLPLARKVMRDRPATWKSHRTLMYEVAKELGVDWEAIPSRQRHILQDLLNASPDFERAARKVREEDARMAVGGIKISSDTH